MYQEREKREEEHQDLYCFTLPQELHLVSLPTSKEIHLRTSKFNTKPTQYTCTPQEAHCTLQEKPLNPTEIAKPKQNPTAPLQRVNPIQIVV